MVLGLPDFNYHGIWVLELRPRAPKEQISIALSARAKIINHNTDVSLLRPTIPRAIAATCEALRQNMLIHKICRQGNTHSCPCSWFNDKDKKNITLSHCKCFTVTKNYNENNYHGFGLEVIIFCCNI